MHEKLQIADDESWKDMTNLQRKIQKHEAFEAEIAANKDELDRINQVRCPIYVVLHEGTL